MIDTPRPPAGRDRPAGRGGWTKGRRSRPAGRPRSTGGKERVVAVGRVTAGQPPALGRREGASGRRGSGHGRQPPALGRREGASGRRGSGHGRQPPALGRREGASGRSGARSRPASRPRWTGTEISPACGESPSSSQGCRPSWWRASFSCLGGKRRNPVLGQSTIESRRNRSAAPAARPRTRALAVPASARRPMRHRATTNRRAASQEGAGSTYPDAIP